jgi:hypothetical protein
METFLIKLLTAHQWVDDTVRTAQISKSADLSRNDSKLIKLN